MCVGVCVCTHTHCRSKYILMFLFMLFIWVMQINILEWFLKDHMTLKTGVTADESHWTKILIVSRQRHSSWNRSRAAALNALDVLNFLYNSEWEPLQMTQEHAAGKLMNHSNWFTNWFTGLIKPLNRIDSKEWIITNEHRSLPREK